MKRTAPKTGKATPAAQTHKAGAGTAVKTSNLPAPPSASKISAGKSPPTVAPEVLGPLAKAPAVKPPAPVAKSTPPAPNGNGKTTSSVPLVAAAASPAAPLPTESSVGLLAAIADIPDAPPVLQLVDDLTSGKPGPMANASRVLEEWLAKKPEVLVPAIDRLIGCINSPHKRVAQTAALALPVMGRLAPARVARHLPALTDKFPECSEVAKDGLVATFAALCTASVAYQKRLEPVLDLALSSADPKTLLRWAEVVLPSLKGEPHARARSVVESRLPSMPRPQAQPIATFLGIKLRPLPV